MAKDPSVLFYTADFLVGTATMEDHQVGKYIKLLCLQHQKIRLSEKEMLKICGEYDEEIFKKFQQDEDGYFNKRMDDEIKKRKAYTDSRKQNLFGHKKEEKPHMDKHMEAHMENENIYIDSKKREGDIKGGRETSKEEEEFISIIKTNYPKLLKMKKPITLESHKKLVEKYGKQLVHEIYLDMQNYVPLLKKNEDANLTANKWIKMHLDRNPEQKKIRAETPRRYVPDQESAISDIISKINKNDK